MLLGRIVCAILIVLTFSCKPVADKNEFKNVIDITEDDFVEKLYVSELFDTIWQVELKTYNDEFISRISRAIVTDNIILIADYVQQKVFLFNANGDYINTINGFGKGPNEYVKITDIFINNRDEIEIINMYGESILLYSLNGEFISTRENKIEEPFNYTIHLQDEDYFYYTKGRPDRKVQKRNYRAIFSVNNKLKFLSTHGHDFSPNFDSEDSYIIKASDKIFLHEPFRNEIYSISNNVLGKEYFIDFKNLVIPEEAFKMKNSKDFWESYITNEKYYHFLSSIQISSNYIFIPLIKLNGEPPFVLYTFINRSTNKATVTLDVIDRDNVSLNFVPKGNLRDIMIFTETKGVQKYNNPSLYFCKINDEL